MTTGNLDRRLRQLERNAAPPSVRYVLTHSAWSEAETEAAKEKALAGAPVGTGLIVVRFVAHSPNDLDGSN